MQFFIQFFVLLLAVALCYGCGCDGKKEKPPSTSGETIEQRPKAKIGWPKEQEPTRLTMRTHSPNRVTLS
uniref:Secreted protein n=1 Tax=Globodera rostochiensis TaxID=31243 RepID=A0A914H485_GLORO